MSPTIYDAAAVEAFRRSARLDPHRIKRLRHQLLRAALPDAGALEELPAAHRARFADEIGLHCLTLEQRVDSRADGATRLIWRTSTEGRMESVILRSPRGRTTLCISSQIGCAAACRFCATGYVRPVRDLSAAQIVDQLTQANQMLRGENRRIKNLVFMGMGEPFHNEAGVVAATEIFLSDAWFALSAKRLVLSTVGLPQPMLRWARRFPQAPLALSLHAVDQDLRVQLMPIAKQHPLDELQATLHRLAEIRSQPVLIEYLMLRDVNDGLQDADALGDFLEGLPVHINLIPYNSIDEAPDLKASERPTRERFGGRLRERGYTVTIRYSQGADIAAACGQLARKPTAS